LHQDAKKMQKMQLWAKIESAKKMQKMQVAFFPSPGESVKMLLTRGRNK
jgi:hypothetical protein